MPRALIMPVTYALLTLALFTLDSASWETRGHAAPAEPPVRQSVRAADDASAA